MFTIEVDDDDELIRIIIDEHHEIDDQDDEYDDDELLEHLDEMQLLVDLEEDDIEENDDEDLLLLDIKPIDLVVSLMQPEVVNTFAENIQYTALQKVETSVLDNKKAPTLRCFSFWSFLQMV